VGQQRVRIRVGQALEQATGDRAWDGAVSLAIALLLVAVAVGLSRQNQQFLIGKAIGPEIEREMVEEIESIPGIDQVLELLTMRLAPDEVLVAARVDLSPGGSGDTFERSSDEVDARLQSRFHEVRHVFLDPTPPRGEGA
jgi:divalent metal cation (Fe/Co/Zn/Cd) transporter